MPQTPAIEVEPLTSHVVFRCRSSHGRAQNLPVGFSFQTAANDMSEIALPGGDYAIFDVVEWDELGVPSVIERSQLYAQPDPEPPPKPA